MPTRTGEPSGRPNERVMLEKDGKNTVSKSFRDDTMLATKGGMPRFSKLKNKIEDSSNLRGFVICTMNQTSGLLFSTDNLSVEKKDYSPAGHGYFVMNFYTNHNEVALKGRKWNDVISFHEKVVKVNGEVYSPLAKYAIDNISQKRSIPYAVPHPSGGYGTSLDNNGDVSRIFEVRNDSVSPLTKTGVTRPSSALLPVSPRADGKALVVGAKIIDGNKAVLRQLFFTGSSWDSISSNWWVSTTEVSMLLTAPYLTSVSEALVSEQAYDTPVLVGGAPGFSTANTTFPETPCGIIGVAEQGFTALGVVEVLWPWRRVLKRAMQGRVETTYYQTSYTGAVSNTVGDIVVSSQNNVYARSNTEQKFLNTQNVQFGDGNSTRFSPRQLSWGGESWNYDLQPSPATPATFFEGNTTLGVIGESLGAASYTSKTQSGSFSIKHKAIELLAGSFLKYESSGQEVKANPNNSWGSDLLADPYGWINASSGLGLGTKIRFEGGAPPELEGAMQAELQSWSEMWHNEMVQTDGSGAGYYYGSVGARSNENTASLSWQTRDYVLHDEREEVFIYLLSTFSATQIGVGAAVGGFNAALVVETTFGSTSVDLYSTSLNFSNFLPELTLAGAGTYTPNPALRIMFAPMYSEQGNFKGAAYTTSQEHVNGETAATLFNFALVLRTYDVVGDGSPDDPYVRLVPCNLLEMLYAYVFSAKYGKDPYERYPIDVPHMHKRFMDNLFNKPFHIHIRNGANVDWSDSFGGAYQTEPYSEIYRS